MLDSMTDEEIIELLQHPTIVGKPYRKQYQLYIGLYQARNLMGADSSGLSDPFVVVHCGGSTFKSDIIMKRLNPMWNRGYVMNVSLLDPISYAAPIVIQVCIL